MEPFVAIEPAIALCGHLVNTMINAAQAHESKQLSSQK